MPLMFSVDSDNHSLQYVLCHCVVLERLHILVYNCWLQVCSTECISPCAVS